MKAQQRADERWSRNPMVQYERYMAEEEAVVPKGPSENFTIAIGLLIVVVLYAIDCMWGLPVG